MQSYENRKKPHICLGWSLYGFAISFIATIVVWIISLNSTWSWITIIVVDAPLFVFVLLMVVFVRLILRKIKKLAETERDGPQINEAVVSEYLALVKATTFQLRVPKKKLEKFKEFVTTH